MVGGRGKQAVTPQDALRRAVEIAGSQAALARILGISQPSVWKWLDKGKPLPAEHVHTVVAATGISKEELRPDLFGEVARVVPASLTPGSPA